MPRAGEQPEGRCHRLAVRGGPVEAAQDRLPDDGGNPLGTFGEAVEGGGHLAVRQVRERIHRIGRPARQQAGGLGGVHAAVGGRGGEGGVAPSVERNVLQQRADQVVPAKVGHGTYLVSGSPPYIGMPGALWNPPWMAARRCRQWPLRFRAAVL